MTRIAANYCRITRHNTRVPKVDAQTGMFRDLAARHGLDVGCVFADDGISASTGAERPGYLAMLDGLKAGEFDALLAQSEEKDRLAVELAQSADVEQGRTGDDAENEECHSCGTAH